MTGITEPIHKHWWQGILARSLFAVMGVAVLLGGASSLIINQTIGAREHRQAVQALGELLDTVESTASVASFANDEQLATEVARGLMRNSDVLRVVIRSGARELARVERERSPNSPDAPPPKVGAGETALPTPLPNQIVRPLMSPFNKQEVIGEMVLDADWPSIDARVNGNARDTVMLLMGQMALIVAVVAAMMIHFIIRPIKKTSDQMHHLGPTSGMLLDVPQGHDNTEIGRLVGDINDLTGRLVATLQQERALQKQQAVAQRKYQVLFEQAASGIFVVDRDGQIEPFNRAFIDLTWLPVRSETADCKLTDPDWREPERLLTLLRNSLDGTVYDGLMEDDFLLDGQRGDERWLHIVITPLGDGSVQGAVTDVTLRKKEELSARRLASTDSLTGLPNRVALQQMFSAMVPNSPPFTLVLIDLNGFARINEAMGFAAGDQLLLLISARIRAFLHEKDSVFRIGGDEFVLLLADGHTRGTVRERLDNFLMMLAPPYELDAAGDPQTIFLGVSAGVAFYPDDGNDLHHLLRNAELALHDARAAGGHVYRYFDPTMLAAVEQRHRLEDDLRHALRVGDMYLAFQPIIDLATLQTTGAEALLRWSHPERGMVPPDVFIPLAEEVGLIGEIGLMVLEGACRQLSLWRKAGLDLYVSVNVSVRQIPDDLPPEVVIGLLKQYDLPPEVIAIEITEGVLMRDVAVAQTWIASLGAAGLRIYLDDFGTGYSSLSYLKRFPMDTVKIDKSFVRDMERDSSDRSLVIAIIEMCRSLGLKVVAEGVENEAQLVILRELGCNYGQGYLFSPAVRGDDFAQVAARIDSELTAGRVSAIGLTKADWG